MQARKRFVFANGLQHHVVEWGDQAARDVIVLCHGFLDLAWGFAQLGPALAAAGLRAVAVDFRGHGESGRVAESGYYYFPDYVLDLHELMPSLVAGPYHLLGHSMGGTVCTMFAANHVEQVRTLSLLEGLGPPGEADSKAPQRAKRWLASVAAARHAEAAPKLRDLDEALTRLRARHDAAPDAFLRLLAEKSTMPHASGNGLTWRFDPLHRTPSPLAFDPERFKHFIGLIEAPTLALEGELGFHELVQADRIALLKRPHHHVIAGAGHMLHWTHCTQVTERVLEHVRASAV
jgi:pimeloyl-ACP methyl ester carboxylesterase